jgi:hemerythrin-like metal-binding protein
MTFVEWTSDLSVGVKEIDDQHKKLFELTNEAYEKKGEKKGINEIFNGLMEYIRVHFTTEEDFFTKCGYDKAEEHIQEHLQFIEDVLDFKKRFDDDDDIIDEFLNFLKEWWVHHLKVVDHQYVENFKACGLR